MNRLFLALPLLTGCLAAPEYVYPVYAPGLGWELYSLEAGVHPYDDILADPNNVFAAAGVGRETKWEILDGGGPVATYYAWGTWLAAEPTGEHQFYTATALADIYRLELADPDEMWAAREMAINGYQAVLDYFPESLTFDSAGRFGFPLAPLAYDGILSLGGVPQGGWIRVTTDEGTTVVQAPSIVNQTPEEPEP